MNKQQKRKATITGCFSIKNWRQGLHQYYSAPLKETFQQFRNGGIFFGTGLILIYMANVYMPSSTKQEIVVLVGLALTVTGFIMAMLAYIRIVIGRILQFISKK